MSGLTAGLSSLKSVEGVVNFYRIVCYLNNALTIAGRMIIHDEHVAQLYSAGVLAVIRHSLWGMLSFGTKYRIKHTHTLLQKLNANQLTMQGHLKTLEIICIGAKIAVILLKNVIKNNRVEAVWTDI